MALPIRKKEENIFDQIGGFFNDTARNIGSFLGSFNKPQVPQQPQVQQRPQQVQQGRLAPFNPGMSNLSVGGRQPVIPQRSLVSRPAPFRPQTPEEFQKERQAAIQSVVETGKPVQSPNLSEQDVKDALMKRVQNQAGGTPTSRALDKAFVKPAQGVAGAVGKTVGEIASNPVDTAIKVVQAPFRAGASVGLSTGLLKPNTSQGTYQAKGIAPLFFGGDDVEKFDPEASGRRIAESTGNIVKNQENSGFGGAIDPKLAAFLGVGGLASELLPGGNARKSVLKETGENAAKKAAQEASSSVSEQAGRAGSIVGPQVAPERQERYRQMMQNNDMYDPNRKLLPRPNIESLAPIMGRDPNNRDFSQEVAQAAEAQKQRYAAPTLRERFGEAINPYRAGANIDIAYAKSLGIPQRDVPKDQSLEALAERTRNSGQIAEQFMKDSNIAPVLQKYGEGTKEGQAFNTYRTFMRDLEQRSDGRTPLYRNYSDQDLQKFVTQYEAENPAARADLKALVSDIERIQDESINRGVVDAETVNAARTKRDGGRYEFYTPVARAQAENLERATINANGVGNIAGQHVIRDLKGSDIPLDPSFNSITDYVNTAYRDIAKADTARVFAERARQGLAGKRFTDTSENAAARKAMRDEQKRTGQPKDMNNYAEFRADPTTGLQTVAGRENGSTFRIEVSPEEARFLQGLGEERLNTLLRVAKAAQSPFRTVLTGALNLPFQVISAGFNAIMGPALSPQGFKVLAPRAVMEAIRSFNSNSEFQKLLNAGGAQKFTGNLDTSRNVTTAEALAAQRNWSSKFKFDVTHPWNLWKKLDLPGAKLENAQRTGIARAAFDARVRKGGNEAEAIADAVYAYNNVLPNFGRVSSLVRQVDAGLMYTGANVAGTRSLLTAIKRDPVGVSTRLGLITTGLVGLTAYSMSQDEAQAFYEDMEASGKGYLLDNNGIIVLPGAHKVTKDEADAGEGREGEWVGVIKLPLPPELRSVNHAIRSQMAANSNETGVPIGDYAQAAFDFVTGGARTLANPGIDLVYGLATNVDRQTGREIVPAELQRKPVEEQVFSSTSDAAKGSAEFINNAKDAITTALPFLKGALKDTSPLEMDYILSKAGFPGQIAKGAGEEGGVAGAVGESVANRFTNTFGQKESTQFYNELDRVAKSIPNDDDMKAFEALHAKKDADSRSIDKTAERYQILLARPGVLEAERQLDAYSRAQGRPGNPLFDLAPEQQEKVFRYRASKDLNAAKQAYDKNGNPLYTALGLDEKWYDDFRNAESSFYSSLKQGNQDDETNTALSFSGAQKPQADPELQQKLDVYYTLPSGTGERSRFLKSNPDVLEHWAKGDQFTNAERVAMGMKVLSDEDGGGSSQGGFARRGGGGSRGGSNNRIYIRSSDYDNQIAIDSAPKSRITVRENNKKIAIKPRRHRSAKVTTTKQKSGKIRVNNQKKQTA